MIYTFSVEFYERIKSLAKARGVTIEGVVKSAGMTRDSYNGYRRHENLPRADEALAIAQELGVSVEYLVTGKENTGIMRKMDNSGTLQVIDTRGIEVSIDGEVSFIPLLDQKVAAGAGQSLLEKVEIVGELPFLTRMLRGTPPARARSLEVRGDSMTGINLHDGDVVVFVPGEIRGDGIYVLRVGDEMLVKRVQFDQVSRKIHIISENTRYKDRIESADGQTVEVVGKVYGWVHSHPY